MEFEWDEEKNKQNRKKHGIWFEEAQTTFADEKARVFYDDRHSEAEDRFLILGMTSSDRVVIVIHCYRRAGEVIRIISARKATGRERKIYEERI